MSVGGGDKGLVIVSENCFRIVRSSELSFFIVSSPNRDLSLIFKPIGAIKLLNFGFLGDLKRSC